MQLILKIGKTGAYMHVIKSLATVHVGFAPNRDEFQQVYDWFESQSGEFVHKNKDLEKMWARFHKLLNSKKAMWTQLQPVQYACKVVAELFILSPGKMIVADFGCGQYPAAANNGNFLCTTSLLLGIAFRVLGFQL